MPALYDVYIDGDIVLAAYFGAFRIDVQANGVDGYDTIRGLKVFSWTYSGEGTFLGLSENSAAVTPDSGLEVGESKTYSTAGAYYFYSVVSSTSSSDLSISYKGSEIASLSSSGTKILKTAGKYMEDDVEVVYTRPSGGGAGWETAPESWASGLIDRTLSGSVYGSMVLTIGSYAFTNCSTLVSVSFPSCTTIGPSAFYGCSTLTSVSFPACTTIWPNAFAQCYALASASFPACTTIGSRTFKDCSALSLVSFPACTTIWEYAFHACYALASASFPLCTTIEAGAFMNCSALASILFPVCRRIGSSAFYSCRTLTLASFPACTQIFMYAFLNCSTLASVSFPSCVAIGSYAFTNCSTLVSVSFPSCTTIGPSAFYSCHTLSLIYFFASSLATLSNSNAFQSTPMQYSSYLGAFGSIYVPSSLVASYKAATNWTYYSSRIVGV